MEKIPLFCVFMCSKAGRAVLLLREKYLVACERTVFICIAARQQDRARWMWKSGRGRASLHSLFLPEKQDKRKRDIQNRTDTSSSREDRLPYYPYLHFTESNLLKFTRGGARKVCDLPGKWSETGSTFQRRTITLAGFVEERAARRENAM
jgi:hypothetical protein